MMARIKAPVRRSGQFGLSVVELLVSLVIGMAVVAGAIQVVVGSKRSFIDQDEVTFIQNNARYALDVLSKDIRMAGYLGCAGQESAQIANSIDNDGGGFISLHGLRGFDGETSTNSFPAAYRADAMVGTDSILIRRAADSGELGVSSHNPNAATIHLWGQHSFPRGTALVIADATCRNVGLFQVSGPNGLPAGHIVHNTGNVNNCTKIIKGHFVCDSSCGPVSCGGYSGAAGGYGPGSQVMEFVSRGYYIGESNAIPGMPALKRQVLNASSTSSEELALGVEAMELVYGVDTTMDGSVDQYRKASEMDLNGDGVITEDEWDQVLAVKVSLVFRSQNPVLPTPEKRILAGKEFDDRYMRQLVSSTFRIRNRG